MRSIVSVEVADDDNCEDLDVPVEKKHRKKK